ncbi:PBECR3 domain-containing polyvalent protein [Vallitalea guaymasensis]|uniref:Phage-Barnase-EndoU-ColicinE5/D-RelE like nuclease 3 domain-containing protein n=1 Tax=Vallitalea guaymasensis TaxID=1185412 RepID=A0A8J8MAY8_9FIRM|nr:PBECR2 nuclease fold domain-containing protein [Vallitalea guaymasensis]QUH29568.1 hypothetical protein HYG85_11890 [Vallitalea guaymasensis]
MIERFDIDKLDKKAYIIGKLNKKTIDLLKLHIDETDIIIGEDKIRYTLKHKNEFKDDEEYKRCIELAPDIIANPDYIGMHPNKKSIEYIKILDKTLVVAVRIKPKGVLWVKTIFTITTDKLEKYIRSGSLKRY